MSRVYEQRRLVPGLRMTYEPAHLRFFQARFEPRAAFLDSVREIEVMKEHAGEGHMSS